MAFQMRERQGNAPIEPKDAMHRGSKPSSTAIIRTKTKSAVAHLWPVYQKLQFGIAALNANDIEGAITHLKASRDASPTDVDSAVREFLFELLCGKGRFGEAITEYKVVLEFYESKRVGSSRETSGLFHALGLYCAEKVGSSELYDKGLVFADKVTFNHPVNGWRPSPPSSPSQRPGYLLSCALSEMHGYSEKYAFLYPWIAEKLKQNCSESPDCMIALAHFASLMGDGQTATLAISKFRNRTDLSSSQRKAAEFLGYVTKRIDGSGTP